MSGTGTPVQINAGAVPADRAAAAAVLAIVAAAEAADGVTPVSEQVLLDLGAAGSRSGVRHLTATADSATVGYAHVDTGSGDAVEAELVVSPPARRHGVGAALLAAIEQLAAPAGLQVWAHGDLRAAAALAAARGYRRGRVLWRMGRALGDDLPEPKFPAGVTLRSFVVGQDEDAWLAVNNRAFATHPDQSGQTRADIEDRERTDWFDPAGFLLAESAGTADRPAAVIGFHWTKVHPATSTEPAVGEVYVLGVDPSAQGQGLGPALTLAGLHHLRSRGLDRVILYVDDSNAAARATYARLDFSDDAVDVQYELGPDSTE